MDNHEMDSPDIKLKDQIIDQCGDAVTKRNLEIGHERFYSLWCVETTEHLCDILNLRLSI